ncbi:hypothetical protein QIA37_05105 (plasmid) [Borrelia sp. CA_690]|nr:hypothetical protein [Borrelia maritima]
MSELDDEYIKEIEIIRLTKAEETKNLELEWKRELSSLKPNA